MADVYSFTFSRVFSALARKVERKGRKREEVEECIAFLFGYDHLDVARMESDGTLWGTFLSSAPSPNPLRHEKKGCVCGICIENIPPGMERDMRILDRMVDEIAGGKPMSHVLMGHGQA